MGQRVMFSNNLDVARRVCDRRMVVLANTAPTYVEVLWNEGRWALGSLAAHRRRRGTRHSAGGGAAIC